MTSAPVQAAEFKVDLKLADVIRIAADQDRHKKRDRDTNDQQDDNNRRNDRRDDRQVENTGRNNGGFNRQQQGGGEERGDNGMSSAYALASQHGRVIDVWPLGGPMFGASVSNSRGKVELLINVNSRRVDERN